MSAANYDILPHAASKDVPRARGSSRAMRFPTCPRRSKKAGELRQPPHTLDTEANATAGVPRITYMPFPFFRIIQMPAMTTILYEYVHATRYIYKRSSHPAGQIEWWMGDSRGQLGGGQRWSST